MNELRTWLRGLPKAELHVHLEGTITPQSYRRIAQRNGVDVPVEPSQLYRCSDFESFLLAFVQVVRVLRKPLDFGEIASAYLQASAREGVRHVEFLVSPATPRYFDKDADLEGMIAAIHQACEQARTTLGISSLLIFDMVRNFGEAAALADIGLARRCARYGVVGIGLGGDERNFPARDFRGAFAQAEELGLRRTVHAGEAAGAQSIIDAVELLHAERIGHGVAAAEEAEVLNLLRRRNVCVDACLTSNEMTGVWNSQRPHPLKSFLAAGLNVTLSSDDPAFFGTSLVDEFERAALLGLNRTDLEQLARNSFRNCFAPEEQKRPWLQDLDSYCEK